jgi:hypothetical protein
LKNRYIIAIIIPLLVVIGAVPTYLIYGSTVANSTAPVSGEHLSVSLSSLQYDPFPWNDTTVTLGLQVNITNTGTQNVTIFNISILNSSMAPIYCQSVNSQLNVSSKATYFLVFTNCPQNCMAQVLTTDGKTFDSNPL